MPQYDLSAFEAPQRDPGGDVVARLAQALASERGAEPPNPLEHAMGHMGQSRQYFPALAAMSGMQQAPPLAQFEGGDHLRQGMPPQQVRGPIQAVKDAFTPRQDEQGNPKADSLGSILSAALMSMPGTGRPVGMIPKGPKFQANQYVEPPVAANGIKPFEHERFRRQLENLLPITSENEAQANMLRSRMHQVDAMPENNYWGRSPSPSSKPNPLTTDLDELYGAPSPQEKARLLGIKLVDPLK